VVEVLMNWVATCMKENGCGMILILSMTLQNVPRFVLSLIASNMVALIISTSNTDGDPPIATYQGTPFSLLFFTSSSSSFNFTKMLKQITQTIILRFRTVMCITVCQLSDINQ